MVQVRDSLFITYLLRIGYPPFNSRSGLAALALLTTWLPAGRFTLMNITKFIRSSSIGTEIV